MFFNQTQNELTSENEGDYTIPPELIGWGRKLFNLPVIRRLRPHARKALSVTRYPGILAFKNTPEQLSESRCEIITAISANLWHDWPFHRRLIERLEAFAQLVEREKADILLLQEVARTNGFNVDEWLARRLGMAFVYSRSNGHSAIGFEEGLAIFSRFPISEPELKRLSNPSNPFVHRGVLGASVETPCGCLKAYSVHLGLGPRDNYQQQEKLRQLLGESNHLNLVLVGGDFNAHETSPQIQQTKQSWLDTFRHLHPTADGHTHAIRFPWGGVLKRHRLDYIFLLPGQIMWRVLEARHLSTPGNRHSDHDVVLTRLMPGFEES